MRHGRSSPQGSLLLRDDERTRTRVDRLDPEDQEQEIAAMMGGMPITPAALENAREILRDTAKHKDGATAAASGKRKARTKIA